MRKEVRNRINRDNAKKSTGPRTPAGKQRSSMNAIKHGLTGNRLLLQDHEKEAYDRLSAHLLRDLAPNSEQEHQFVQRIIDAHARLNRAAAIDGSLLNFRIHSETGPASDDPVECVVAQCRAWLETEESLDRLSRYEARIAQQLRHNVQEFERLRAERERQARFTRFLGGEPSQPIETVSLNPESASFCKFSETKSLGENVEK